MVRGKLEKSSATRERIMSAAVGLFGEKGFSAATMREIAGRAGCSVGLAYRYYRTKDDIALSLYERLMEEFADSIAELPPGPLARRWAAVMRADVARMEPYRQALTGLTSAGLTPGAPTQVLGPESREVRRRMLDLYRHLLAGAADIPRAADAESIVTLLYGLHLLLMLFWLQDPTPNQKATSSLLSLGEEALGWLRLLTRLPGFASVQRRITETLNPILDG